MRIASPQLPASPTAPDADEARGLERAWRGALLVSLSLLPFSGVLPQPWPGTPLRWSDLPLALALVLFVAARGRTGLVSIAPWQWAAIGYAGWVAVSWLAHGDGSGLKVAGVFALVGSAILASALTSAAILGRVVALGVIGSAALALAGALAHALGYDTPLVGWAGGLVAGQWSRPLAGSTHPNMAASFALLAFGWTAAEVSPRLRRVARVCAAIVIVFAFSRAVVSLLALPGLLAGRRRARVSAIAAGIVLVLMSVVHIELDPSRPWDVAVSTEGSHRRITFESAAGSLAASPLAGVGPGSLPARLEGHPFHAHCTPLNVAATYGLPALAFFALACVSVLRNSHSPAALATLVALLLDGLTTDVEDFRHFWLALGLAGSSGSGAGGGAASVRGVSSRGSASGFTPGAATR